MSRNSKFSEIFLHNLKGKKINKSLNKNLSNQTYLTKINKSDFLEYHSLTKNDTRIKENSTSKIEKQLQPKNLSIKTFVPNQKLTKKLNEAVNKQDLYLTTEITKNFSTSKNSPQKSKAIANKSYISNKINNSSFHKSVLVKEENKKDNLDFFFSEIEKFNINLTKINNFEILNLDKVFQNFETIATNLEENKKLAYSQVWKNFLQNLEKFCNKNSNLEAIKQLPKTNKDLSKPKQTIHAYNNISHLNNNNFNFQFVEASNMELEKLKKYLNEKEKEIRDLRGILDTKDKKLKEIEKIKVPNLKNNYMSHNVEKSNIEVDQDHEELMNYQNKQLMRDYKNLSSENKNLREVVSQLEKDMKTSKEKEIKIMHILYSLKKKGVMIENLLAEEFPKELADLNLNFRASRIFSENSETSMSLDNSMFTPICIDTPPMFFKKPDKIPALNLDNINSLFNKDYLSPSKLKEKKNMIAEKKEENVIKEKEKEILKEITINKNLFNSNKVSRDKAKKSQIINATVDVSSNIQGSPSIQFKTLNETKTNMSPGKIKISNIHNPRISLQMNLKDKISFKERIKNILKKN